MSARIKLRETVGRAERPPHERAHELRVPSRSGEPGNRRKISLLLQRWTMYDWKMGETDDRRRIGDY